MNIQYNTVRDALTSTKPQELTDNPADDSERVFSGVIQATRVQVNQRALIDKILARYSSEWAVYRELLQNSDDAEATIAEIRFDTTSEDDSNTINHVVYRNNGFPFRDQDWKRLQTVAEGNPDVDKVGAFGVGAYAMFSICEEPMVMSGDRALLFQWQDDHLWVKTCKPDDDKTTHDGYNSEKDETQWTTFSMPLRDSNTENPLLGNGTVAFGKFLVNSLIFASSLQEIRVFVNRKITMRFSKESSSAIPAGSTESTCTTTLLTHDDYDFETTSPRGYFSVANYHQDVQKRVCNVTVEIEGDSSSVLAHYVRATMETHIPSPVASQMERVTKKSPPPRVVVKVLQTESAGAATGEKHNKNTKAHKVTRHFLTASTGNIFIGFKTSQTTGVGAHVAAPFVPTVEREAIDLQDPHLCLFNTELLHACGMVLRLALEQRMMELETPFLGEQLEDINMEGPELSPTQCQAVLVMKAFKPKSSTPQAQVGRLLWKGFQRALEDRKPPVLTSSGLLAGDQGAKLPFASIECIVRDNVVPLSIYRGAQEYLETVALCPKLSAQDLITFITFKTLTEEELVYFLADWCAQNRWALTVSMCRAIRKITFFQNNGDIIRNFGDYTKFTNRHHGENYQLPVPSSVIPRDLQDRIGTIVIAALHEQFTLLTPEEWLVYICKYHPSLMDNEETVDSETFERRLAVLSILSGEYRGKDVEGGNASQWAFRDFLRKHLKEKHCIPYEQEDGTFAFAKPHVLFSRSSGVEKLGLGKFRSCSARLHDAGVTDEFLVALGVQRAVSTKVLLDQLGQEEWSENPKAIVSYLRSLPLTDRDRESISKIPCFAAEGFDKGLFAARELCLPNNELRRLFPFVKQLRWPEAEKLPKDSGVGKFLVSLGMSAEPDNVFEMLQHVSAVDLDWDQRRERLKYVSKLLEPSSVQALAYGKSMASSLKFLPATQMCPFTSKVKRALQAPTKCYYDTRCAVMGYYVIDPKLNAHFYGRRFACLPQPSIRQLHETLLLMKTRAENTSSQMSGRSTVEREATCRSIEQAFDAMFGYLSKRALEFEGSYGDLLANEKIVPCRKGTDIYWQRPADVFFDSPSHSSDARALFDFVKPCPFLSTCGVRNEPLVGDFLQQVLKSPKGVLKRLGSEERYRSLLQKMAAKDQYFSPVDEAQMKRTAFLLAYCSSGGSNDVESKKEDREQEQQKGPKDETTCSFAKPEDIVIVDNSFLGSLFPVYRAPFESDLEAFYSRLGSKRLSEVVKKRYKWQDPACETPATVALRKRISERAPHLVAPATSRQLTEKAAATLQSLEIRQVPEIDVTYAMGHLRITRTTTCCVKPSGTAQKTMLVTENYDWFDVGMALGSLISTRCHLDDAFFIGSFLEAPLELLRARGFQLNRVLVQKAIIMDEDDETSMFHVPYVSGIMATAKSAAAQVVTTTGAQGSEVGSALMGFFRSAGRKIESDSLSEPLLDPTLAESEAIAAPRGTEASSQASEVVSALSESALPLAEVDTVDTSEAKDLSLIVAEQSSAKEEHSMIPTPLEDQPEEEGAFEDVPVGEISQEDATKLVGAVDKEVAAPEKEVSAEEKESELPEEQGKDDEEEVEGQDHILSVLASWW